jgi:hypothetical protein
MHHYGRHGPHAWLRLHQHRFKAIQLEAQPLTALVVSLPVSLEIVERVIVIVISDFNNDENDVQEQHFHLVENAQPSQLPMSKEDDGVISAAELYARRYIRKLIRSIQDGELSIVPPKVIQTQVRNDFDKYLSEQFDGKGIALSEDRENQIEKLFTDTFIAKINQKKLEHPEIFPSDCDIHLHNVALQDKQANPDRNQSEIDLVGTLRAVQILDLTIDTALTKVSTLLPITQQYQKYYRTIDADKEAIWDTQGTF